MRIGEKTIMLFRPHPFFKVGNCSPNLMDNVDVEGDKYQKRNDENDDGHPTEIHLMPDGWPASEVTDTLQLKGAVHG